MQRAHEDKVSWARSTRGSPPAWTAAVVVALWGASKPLSAQIALEWSRSYDLPEALDGDCSTDALAVLSDGSVAASVHTNYPPQVSRFLRYAPSGALAWSRRWGPPSQTLYTNALATGADDVCFVGPTLAGPGPGASVVRVAANGDLRWSAVVPAQLSLASPVRATLTSADELWIVASEGGGAGPTLWTAFSASGVELFTHRVELDPSAAELVRALVAAPGGVVVAGAVGSRAVVAALDASGQVAWSNEASGAAGMGAEFSALDIDAAGGVAAAGTALAAAGRQVFVRRFDSAGAVSASAEVDIGATVDARVGAARFASDGALWIGGWKRDAAASRFFALRFPADGGAARQLDWIAGSGAGSRALLAPGAAGQVWAVTRYATPWPLFAERVAVLQLTHGVESGVNLRATFGDGIEARQAHVAALIPGEALFVGGRAEQFLSGPVYFEPLAWVAKFDVRASPEGYCPSQAHSGGCAPSLVFDGLPSVVSGEPFIVSVQRLLSRRTGLFLYAASAPASTPWLGGTLCLTAPLRRTPLLDSGGALDDPCSGELALDWSLFASGALGGAPAPELLAPGTTIRLQALSRDPQAAGGVNLSSALRYVVLP